MGYSRGGPPPSTCPGEVTSAFDPRFSSKQVALERHPSHGSGGSESDGWNMVLDEEKEVDGQRQVLGEGPGRGGDGGGSREGRGRGGAGKGEGPGRRQGWQDSGQLEASWPVLWVILVGAQEQQC